jgi:hypothetical protein
MRLSARLLARTAGAVVAAALVAASMTWALQPQRAEAFVLEGPVWSNAQPHTCCYHLTWDYQNPGPDFIFDNPADVQGWRDAATAWNQSAALVFYDQDRFSPNHLSEANDGTVNWDGLSMYNFTTDAAGNQTMTDSTDFLNAFYTQNYTAGQIQSVAAHELGHVAGLGHSTGCTLMVGDTFTRWTTCGVNTPQQDEVDGINSLY